MYHEQVVSVISMRRQFNRCANCLKNLLRLLLLSFFLLDFLLFVVSALTQTGLLDGTALLAFYTSGNRNRSLCNPTSLDFQCTMLTQC